MVLVGSAVYTLGELLGGPVLAALAAEAAPDHLRGRYLSLIQLAWNLTGTIAPVAVRVAARPRAQRRSGWSCWRWPRVGVAGSRLGSAGCCRRPRQRVTNRADEAAAAARRRGAGT